MVFECIWHGTAHRLDAFSCISCWLLLLFLVLVAVVVAASCFCFYCSCSCCCCSFLFLFLLLFFLLLLWWWWWSSSSLFGGPRLWFVSCSAIVGCNDYFALIPLHSPGINTRIGCGWPAYSGYGSKLSNYPRLIGWWLLKLDFSNWFPRSWILSHPYIWMVK